MLPNTSTPPPRRAGRVGGEGRSVGVWLWGPQRRRRQINNEVPDLGHGRVGWWVPCLDEVVGFVFGFIPLVLYVGGSGGSGP